MNAPNVPEVSLLDVIQQVVDSTLEGVRICLPGKVESYDPATRRADVKPLLKRVYADGEIEALPVITSVPVVWPGGGGGALGFPLTAGDGVLIVFGERNMENFLETGVDSVPLDGRKFDMSDAIAIPGLYSFKTVSPFPDNLAAYFAFSGGFVKLQPNGKIAIGNAAAELLEIISDGLNLLATGLCASPGSPLTIAPQAALLKTKLDTLLRGSL